MKYNREIVYKLSGLCVGKLFMLQIVIEHEFDANCANYVDKGYYFYA